MDFLADDTIPESSVELIRAFGHDVATRRGLEPEAFVDRACEEDRIPMTRRVAIHDAIFSRESPRPDAAVCFDFEPDTPRDLADALAPVFGDDNLLVLGYFSLLDGESLKQRPMDD